MLRIVLTLCLTLVIACNPYIVEEEATSSSTNTTTTDTNSNTSQATWFTQLGNDTVGANASGTEATFGNSLALDSSDNLFICGHTDGVLGGGTSGGSNDVFVSKFDSSGTHLWTTQLNDDLMGADADGDDKSWACDTDSDGAIYVGGSTTGELGGETNGGSGDVFISKINASGTHQWTVQLGDATMGNDADGDDSVRGLTLDGSGNIFIVGYTYGDLGEAVGGNSDIFIAKFNSAGTLQWVSQLGDTTMGADADQNDVPSDIVLDASGNIFVSGNTNGELGGQTNGGSYDVTVSKFNSSGTHQWTSQMGDTTMGAAADSYENTQGIAIDSSDNLYVVGQTQGALGETNGGFFDPFIAKFSSAGVYQWTAQLGDATLGANADGWETVADIVLDGDENILITGSTNGAMGGGTPGGGNDIYYSLFNPAGAHQWTKQFDDEAKGTDADGSDSVYQMKVDSQGYLIFSGITQGTLGGEDNAGNSDVFACRINSDGTL